MFTLWDPHKLAGERLFTSWKMSCGPLRHGRAILEGRRIALLTAGVGMDVLGIAYEEFPGAERQAAVATYPRTAHFNEDIIQTFHNGIKQRPETTYGTVNADVLADKDPDFQRGNFCSVILASRWPR
jgi:hypothetical protein